MVMEERKKEASTNIDANAAEDAMETEPTQVKSGCYQL